MPYHLLGLISMTPALWVFLFAQVAMLLFALALCVVRVTTAVASGRLVLGNTVALVLSVVVSVLTVLAGFLQSFAASGPDNEKAAQLASGILTVMNGLLMAVPFAVLAGGLLALQVGLRLRDSGGEQHQE
jgi:hypothetical protein